MHAWRLALFAVLLGTASFGSTAVAIVTVNDSGDGGPGNCAAICTLRDAIAASASGDTINFALTLPATITLTQGPLSVGKSLTIQGPGAAQLAISANALSRVLSVGAGTVDITGVTLRDGTVSGGNGLSGVSGTGSSGQGGIAASGGCINVAASASLVLDRAAIRNCVAKGGNGGNGGTGTNGNGVGDGGPGGAGGAGANGSGGGIYTAGDLTLLNTSLINGGAYGGAAGGGGNGGIGGSGFVRDGVGGNGGIGGSANGGAIYVAAGATLLISNSTIPGSVAVAGRGGDGGNSSDNNGGNGGNGGDANGGLIYITASVAPADLEFATLTNGNVTQGQGGLGGGGSITGLAGQSGTRHGNAISTASAASALSSIIVGAGPTLLCDGTVVAASGSVNLDQDSSCTGFTLHGTFAALLRPLVLNTPWPAYTPVYHSAVIDAAATCNDLTAQPVTSDQHGTPRPQGSACDLGAIEADYIFFNGFD